MASEPPAPPAAPPADQVAAAVPPKRHRPAVSRGGYTDRHHFADTLRAWLGLQPLYKSDVRHDGPGLPVLDDEARSP